MLTPELSYLLAVAKYAHETVRDDHEPPTVALEIAFSSIDPCAHDLADELRDTPPTDRERVAASHLLDALLAIERMPR